MAEEKKTQQQRYSLTEVPTEYGLAIQDNTDGTKLDEKSILLIIVNGIAEIKKELGLK